MKRFILLLILAAFAWKAYDKYSHAVAPGANLAEASVMVEEEAPNAPPANVRLNTSDGFACDGRTYCSQMTSCNEAKYFLQNCPDVKMDGNHDGVPCEKQWCR